MDSETPIDTFGGGSLIVDHQGRVVGRHAYSGGSSWVAGTIDIEALRHFRVNSKWGNWMKDLTTEQYQVIYEQPVLSEEPLPRALAVHARTSTSRRCCGRTWSG